MATHTGTRTGVCTVSELPQNTQKKVFNEPGEIRNIGEQGIFTP